MDSKKLRLVLLIPSLAGGGAEKVAAVLAPHFAEMFDFTLVLLEDRRAYPLPDNVRVISLSPKLSGLPAHFIRMPLFWWKLKQLWKKLPPDVVLSFMEQANFLNILSREPNKHGTVIGQQSDCAAHYAKKGLFGKIMFAASAKLYPKADYIVAASQGVGLGLADKYHLESSQIIDIGNPININELQTKSDSKLPDNAPAEYILHVGRLLNYHKGQDILLDAFSIISKSHKDLHLVMLGEGPDRQWLEKRVGELGLQDFVHMPGWQDNVASWMANAEFMLFPSRFEGWPLAVIEALACGCPVIASDCPHGPREILYNGKCGVLTPTDDAQALADEALKLLSDDKKRQALKEGGLLRAGQFDAPLVAERYAEVIRSAML